LQPEFNSELDRFGYFENAGCAAEYDAGLAASIEQDVACHIHLGLLSVWETSMTRFFFNLATKGSTISDSKGREFADLAAAHRHAMQLVHKMVLLDGTDWEGWYIKITDLENQSLLSVLFPQTSRSPGQISVSQR
jgi:hypothetical protein